MKLQGKQKHFFFSNNLYKAVFECRWSTIYKRLKFFHLVEDTSHNISFSFNSHLEWIAKSTQFYSKLKLLHFIWYSFSLSSVLVPPMAAIMSCLACYSCLQLPFLPLSFRALYTLKSKGLLQNKNAVCQWPIVTSPCPQDSIIRN
jgi:hypothetical protein